MMITGISILGGSYGVALLMGLILVDEDNYSCSDCGEVGAALFVPVAGPFIASAQADDDGGVLAALGLVQVVGAGLTIGGIIKYKNSKRRAQQQGFVVDLAGGKAMAFDVSASRQLAGPHMKLTF